MGEQRRKKNISVGLLAHVDAGKTTLSEAMLYISGSIRNFGRVDHGDAFLDTFALERKRGITIFSKQALVTLPDLNATLLDTPGHVDFSAEMERTLDVLDCAILVISGPAGVQSHTLTLWRLLRQRNIPTFVFINKMDLPGPTKSEAVPQSAPLRCGAFRRGFGFSRQILRLDQRHRCRAKEAVFGVGGGQL